MNSALVRKTFLDFFKSKQHQVVESAPMVIKDDPTLMFTNAGMNQFKDIFLGTAPAKFKRIANTQKCLRVSGKHNDLEEVGVDTYHHTMFEMLGNWSFGDYFKKEAIEWSYELLAEVYKIDKNKLYVTVFEGSKEDNIPFDNASFEAWKKYFPEDRILYGNKKDNFWEMGDTGPCGPCTEIHVDIRSEEEIKKIPGKELVNKGHPQVIEIWNNVFMEYNRKADGSLEKLPAQHVDTGMGFERLCMVLQGKQSNYDTDVFMPLIQQVEKMSGFSYKQGKVLPDQEEINIAMRVIADHIRAISFSIADGQLPGNTGAGYVIRRILRRAVRYGYQTLKLKEPFLFRLAKVLSEQLGTAFLELDKQKDLIEKVIKEEETSFYRTLESGLRKIETVCSDAKAKNATVISGKIVFELYDTYGFPADLTSLIARANGLSIDEAGFEKELEVQKNRSREAAQLETEDWVKVNDFDTNSIFVGYEQTSTKVKIVKYRKVKIKNKPYFQFVLNQTPFYAESGGQVGDTGVLKCTDESIVVTDTKKEFGEIVHFCDDISKLKNLHSEWTASVDSVSRKHTERNHSATHLLHAALRQVLGTHVEQKGSLVNPEYLRFDFSHFAKVTEEELVQIENIVNERIRESITSSINVMPIGDAKKMGAMALFGEKYGEQVRVVVFKNDYSIELCGGTHVPNTSQIGLFKIVSESAIAAGVRRIEAITSQKAVEYLNNQLNQLNSIKSLLNNPKEVVKAVESLIQENIERTKTVEKLINEKAYLLKNELIKEAKSVNGVQVVCRKVDLSSPEALKNIAFELKSKENYFVVLGAEISGKPSLTVAISENVIKEKNLNASAIVKDIAKEIKGGGGGQPGYATAGGTDLKGLDNAINKALNTIQ